MGAVFGTVGALLFILINLGFGDSLPWLFRMFWFVLPQINNSDFSINFTDIMKIFSVLALIFSVIKIFVSKPWKSVESKSNKSIKKTIIYFTIISTVIYVLMFFSLRISDKINRSDLPIFYLIILIFYLITIFSGIIYFLLTKTGNKITYFLKQLNMDQN
jgi:hypothetical protein